MLHLAVGNVAVGLEQVGHLLERNPQEVDELDAVLGEERAQQGAALFPAHGLGAGLRGGRRHGTTAGR